jgi:hypothetical protein
MFYLSLLGVFPQLWRQPHLVFAVGYGATSFVLKKGQGYESAELFSAGLAFAKLPIPPIACNWLIANQRFV